MKYSVLAIVWLALASLLPACAPYYGEGWVQISEGGFSVMMPGRPTRGSEKGGITFQLDTGDAAYHVIYATKTTTSMIEPEQHLDMLRNGFLSDYSGRMTSERNIGTSGYNGREVIAEDASGAKLVIRFYRAKSIIYGVIVLMKKGTALSADAEKFLSSFKIQSL